MFASNEIIQHSNLLSRREFIKFAGAGLFSLIFAPLIEISPPQALPQGRVISDNLALYDIPSTKGNQLKEFYKDNLLSISEVTIGDEEPAYNRVWYRIANEGFVHSGMVQPVLTKLNTPVQNIPSTGLLGEVTVPFTDAFLGPAKTFPVGYRYYFETTHWVLGYVTGPDGEPWYHIYEDKWENRYYAPARHIRIIPADELTPLSPEIPFEKKRIEVLTKEQAVVAYEKDVPVYVTKVATGARYSNGNFSTPPGRHMTFHKRPSRHMAAGNLAYNGYDLPGVPWICYFTESGISFHGTYWHNNYGRPRSHGCINMTPQAAKWLYRWTLPVVPPDQLDVYEKYGTIVDVITY